MIIIRFLPFIFLLIAIYFSYRVGIRVGKSRQKKEFDLSQDDLGNILRRLDLPNSATDNELDLKIVKLQEKLKN